MGGLLLLGVGLVVFTKALDCVSTVHAVRSPGGETNPLARALMWRMGVRPTVVLVFLLAGLWSAALAGLAFWSGSLVLQWGVVAQSILVAVVQGAVAHTNWTGRWNGVTRSVLEVHARIGRARAARGRHVAAGVRQRIDTLEDHA